jgi:hypothetical protein
VSATAPGDKEPAKKRVRATRAPRKPHVGGPASGMPASGIPAGGGPPKGAGNGNPKKDFNRGHGFSLMHGGGSKQLEARYPQQVAEARRLVAEAVQGLPAASPAFAIQRGVLAERLVRYQLVSSWLDDNGGEIDPTTAEAKGAANFAAKQLAAIERTLDSLGLSPRSAAALYGDLARSVPLAEQLIEARAVRERRLSELDGGGEAR